MIETYKRLPLWIRWILFLPLSILFSFLVVLVLSLLRKDFEFIHPAAVIVSFSYAIYMFAPRWKNQFILSSLILRMIFSIGMISIIFMMGETPNKSTSFEIFRELFGWFIGWGLYFLVFRENAQN